MTTANVPRRRTTPLRAKDVPDIAPRIAPVPLVAAPTTPGALPPDGPPERAAAPPRRGRRLTARR